MITQKCFASTGLEPASSIPSNKYIAIVKIYNNRKSLNILPCRDRSKTSYKVSNDIFPK